MAHAADTRAHKHARRGTRTHARPSSPETHLELHDRLADHREQPRRQRDQLRRELRVRRTGGDRRRRLAVPREQHIHEQLEPLQQHIMAFAYTRSSRQEERRVLHAAAEHSSKRAVSRVLSGSGMPLGYPVSTVEYPQ